MADAQVTLNVSKEIIDAHVRSDVASVLSKNPEDLIRRVVDVAMSQKDNYARETLWEAAVNKMIRDVAEETFKKWIEEQRPNIERAVRARLDGKDRKGLVEKVAERLTGALGDFRVRIDTGNDR